MPVLFKLAHCDFVSTSGGYYWGEANDDQNLLIMQDAVLLYHAEVITTYLNFGDDLLNTKLPGVSKLKRLAACRHVDIICTVHLSPSVLQVIISTATFADFQAR